MFRQIFISLFYNFLNSAKKVFVYTILCGFFIFSLLIFNVVDCYNEAFDKSIDFYVSVIAPVNLLQGEDIDNYQGYHKAISDYIVYLNKLSDGKYEYSYELYTRYHNPIKWLDGNKFFGYLEQEYPNDSSVINGYTAIKTVNRVNHSDIVLKAIRITEGNNFSEDKLSGNYCLIGEDFFMIDKEGSRYSINIGDRIPLSIINENDDGGFDIIKTSYYEVIGKYCLNDNVIGIEAFSMSMGGRFVPIYIPEDSYMKLHEEALSVNSSYYNDSIISKTYEIEPGLFQFVSRSDFDDFMESLEKSKEYLDGKIVYYTSIDDYIPIISNIDAFGKGFEGIAIVCAIIVPLILFIYMVLDVIYRFKESAIYIALGQKRLSVILMYSLENIVLGVIALTISSLLAGILGRYILDRYLLSSLNIIDDSVISYAKELYPSFAAIGLFLFGIVLSALISYFLLCKRSIKELLR